MHQRIIHTHVNFSSKAYVYDDTIYNFCARARFAGCTYLRHLILALNTVQQKLNFISDFRLQAFLSAVCEHDVQSFTVARWKDFLSHSEYKEQKSVEYF